MLLRSATLAAVGFALIGAQALAQSQEVIEAVPPTIPESVWDDGSTPGPRPVPGTPFPYVMGQLVIRPHLSYSYIHSKGIRSQPGVSVSTNRHRVAPGVLFELGERWLLDYTATWNFYSNEAFNDTVDHSVRLAGAVSHELWNASLSHRSARTNSVLIETARQTKQTQHGTNLRFSRPLSQRLFGDVSLAQNLRYVSNLPNVYDRSVSPGVTYLLGPGLSTFGTVQFGHTEVVDSTNMEYRRPQVGVNWRVSEKLSASAFAGREWRKFKAEGVPTRQTPMYGANLVYHPLPTTSVSVGASRQAGASYFSGLVTESTQWSIDFGQRLLGRLRFSAGLSRSESDYRSTTPGLELVRDDDRRTRYVRLGTDFLQGGSVGVGYRKTKNTSSSRDFAFNSEMFTIDVSYRY